MLHLNLAAVDRGEVRLREQVPPDHPMWEDTGVELTAPVEVDLTANSVGEGVLVRGTLKTRVRQPCRRCLEPVDAEIGDHVDLHRPLPAAPDAVARAIADELRRNGA